MLALLAIPWLFFQDARIASSRRRGAALALVGNEPSARPRARRTRDRDVRKAVDLLTAS
jgi:hypothetical protein